MAASSRRTSRESTNRKNWLGRYLVIQVAHDAAIDAALQGASDMADAALAALEGRATVSAKVRRAQLLGARGALTLAMNGLFKRTGQIIRQGQAEAAQAAVQARFSDDEDVMKALVPDLEKRRVLQKSMEQSAARGVQVMMRRVLGEDSTLSERVYRSNALANRQIHKLVDSHLAIGSSAEEIARDVRSSILPSAPGGVSYAAKRLARTEMNNAFHAQAIADARDRPWIIAMQWNLSGSHPSGSGCKCEFYAKLGAFPTSAVPNKPHPNCLCYVVPVVEPWESFSGNVVLGRYTSWPGLSGGEAG